MSGVAACGWQEFASDGRTLTLDCDRPHADGSRWCAAHRALDAEHWGERHGFRPVYSGAYIVGLDRDEPPCNVCGETEDHALHQDDEDES